MGLILLPSTDARFAIPALLDDQPSDPLLAAAASGGRFGPDYYRGLDLGRSGRAEVRERGDGGGLEEGQRAERDGDEVEQPREDDDDDDEQTELDQVGWLEAWLEAQHQPPANAPLSWDASSFPSRARPAGAASPFPAQPADLAQALLAASLGASTKSLVGWDARRQAYSLDAAAAAERGAGTGLATRALEVGSWARRLDAFVKALRDDPAVPSVGHALASALEDVVAHVLGPLQALRPGSALALAAALAEAHAVLGAFAAGLSLANLGRSPKPPVKALREPLNVLALGWALVEGAVASSAPAAVVDATRWLWTAVGAEWATAVERWLAGEDDGAWSVGAVHSVDAREPTTAPAEETWSFDARRLPTFIPADAGRDLFYGGFARRLLNETAPAHPLCATGKRRGGRDRVFAGWCWSEPQAQRTRDDWAAREREAKERIAAWKAGGLPTLSRTTLGAASSSATANPPSSALSVEQRIKDLGRLFGGASKADLVPAKPDVALPAAADPTLAELLAAGSAPLTVSALAPLVVDSLHGLRAHAALVSHALLASIFTTAADGGGGGSSDVLRQFALLPRFLLFRDNDAFVSRLKRALFGDGQSVDRAVGLGARARIRERMGMAPAPAHAGGSTRRGGVALGLGLSDRTSWPPGGAELNIALRGTLIEAVDELAAGAGSAGAERAWRAAEDRLGFVVRDPPDDAGGRWREPGRIEALDFLQVSYRPPREIAVVVGRRALEEYARVQGVLLRLFRVEAVVRFIHLSTMRPGSRPIFPAGSRALRDLVAVRHSASLLVTALLGWVFDDVLRVRYAPWEAQLVSLAADLSAGRTGPLATVQDLLGAHEAVLRGLTASVWLEPGQERAMGALVECWTTCLGVGELVRDGLEGAWAEGSADQQTAMDGLRALRRALEVHTQQFVAHLSSSAQAADARDFSPLLVRLDASRRASALGSRVDG